MASWCSMLLRGSCLFSLGVFFFWIADTLQGLHGGFIDPNSWLCDFINPNLLFPLCCGVASVVVGLLSPFFDSKLGLHDVYNREWSSILRCIALFIGFNQAITRINFASYLQLAIVISGLSVGFWYAFDRSSVGFAFGAVVALIATIFGHSFVRRRLFKFSHPTMAAWIPCLFFSGCVTIVLIGRQLAKSDMLASFEKKAK